MKWLLERFIMVNSLLFYMGEITFEEVNWYRDNPSTLTTKEMAVYKGMSVEQRREEEDLGEITRKESQESRYFLRGKAEAIAFINGSHPGYGYGQRYIEAEKSNEAVTSIGSGQTQRLTEEIVRPGMRAPAHKVFPASSFPRKYGGPTAIAIEDPFFPSSEDLSPILRPSERRDVGRLHRTTLDEKVFDKSTLQPAKKPTLDQNFKGGYKL
jgi:hypothetical protein